MQVSINEGVLDVYDRIKTVNGRQLKVEVQDTSGQDEAALHRAKQYKQADVFMLCFSVDLEDNSDETVYKWISEIRNAEQQKPIILVLTKNDLLKE